MNALSVGFPGLLKSSFTPFKEANRFKLLEMKSGPLSTRIVCGLPCCQATPSETRTTSSPVNPGWIKKWWESQLHPVDRPSPVARVLK